MKYIPGLNGLRAIAVFFVVFYHWEPPPVPGFHFLTKILPDGRFGVNLFFVLSGFLISSILFIEKKKLSASHSVKQVIIHFYIRRILRIFPVYYLTLAVVYLLGAPEFNDNLVYYLTYTENFHLFFSKTRDFFMHSWSLSVEEQFYIFWPFIILFMDRDKIFKVLVFFIFLGPAYSFFQTHVLKEGFKFFLMPACLDAFGIGALIAYYYTENNLGKIKKWVKRLLPLSLMLFIYWQLEPNGHLQWLIRFFESIISAGAILFCLSERYAGIVSRILENPVLRRLGMVSYGIYLFHYPLPYFYHRLRSNISYSETIPNSMRDYGLMTLILISLAFLSYYILEKPVLSLKSRFKY
jgi:peptidoglycan/LPS O-acetylase OafA/YrhL